MEEKKNRNRIHLFDGWSVQRPECGLLSDHEVTLNIEQYCQFRSKNVASRPGVAFCNCSSENISQIGILNCGYQLV